MRWWNPPGGRCRATSWPMNSSLYRREGGQELSASGTASGGLGPNQRTGDRPVDQSPPLRPTTIAAIYKDRWEIELFLIAILLLKWLHHLSKAKWSLSNLASMLRLNLFTYRDLRDRSEEHTSELQSLRHLVCR